MTPLPSPPAAVALAQLSGPDTTGLFPPPVDFLATTAGEPIITTALEEIEVT